MSPVREDHVLSNTLICIERQDETYCFCCVRRRGGADDDAATAAATAAVPTISFRILTTK